MLARAMSGSVRAVVFDMDGTLVVSHEAITDAYAATLVHLGAAPRSRQEIVRAFPLGPAAAILARLLERPVSGEELESYFRQLGLRARRVRAYPGVVAALALLAERAPLGVFSGASTRSCEILLEATLLRPYFTAIVGGDLVERPKPAPDGIVATCTHLGLPPSDVAYVGDSPLDLEAARSAGALAVAAGWGELFDPANEADVVAGAPAELLSLVREQPG